ncbi:hypothetical protein [Gilliamella sp. Gris1-4]|uniref:hypothetical protein n=1 Tax=Gilliamella sp. Gris1-4 TaxID=3120244 RepID=UPI0011477FF6|nr:hypothetical protein [Gilliamella apicola]
MIRLPSGNSIAKKVSVLVAFVLPPSKIKYGALPSMTLDVCTVNACIPCVYDNNNNGAKNSADFDNNEGLNNNRSLNSNCGLDTNGGFNNHLDIDGKDPDDGIDFAMRNDFDDENNCGDLLWPPCESIRFRA